MGLTRCKDCATEVSDRAPVCPRCGGPIDVAASRSASGTLQAAPVGPGTQSGRVLLARPASESPGAEDLVDLTAGEQPAAVAAPGTTEAAKMAGPSPVAPIRRAPKIALAAAVALCLASPFAVLWAVRFVGQRKAQATAEAAYVSGRTAFEASRWADATRLLEAATPVRENHPDLAGMLAVAKAEIALAEGEGLLAASDPAGALLRVEGARSQREVALRAVSLRDRAITKLAEDAATAEAAGGLSSLAKALELLALIQQATPSDSNAARIEAVRATRERTLWQEADRRSLTTFDELLQLAAKPNGWRAVEGKVVRWRGEVRSCHGRYVEIRQLPSTWTSDVRLTLRSQPEQAPTVETQVTYEGVLRSEGGVIDKWGIDDAVILEGEAPLPQEIVDAIRAAPERARLAAAAGALEAGEVALAGKQIGRALSCVDQAKAHPATQEQAGALEVRVLDAAVLVAADIEVRDPKEALSIYQFVAGRRPSEESKARLAALQGRVDDLQRRQQEEVRQRQEEARRAEQLRFEQRRQEEEAARVAAQERIERESAEEAERNRLAEIRRQEHGRRLPAVLPGATITVCPVETRDEATIARHGTMRGDSAMSFGGDGRPSSMTTTFTFDAVARAAALETGMPLPLPIRYTIERFSLSGTEMHFFACSNMNGLMEIFEYRLVVDLDTNRVTGTSTQSFLDTGTREKQGQTRTQSVTGSMQRATSAPPPPPPPRRR